MTTYTSKHGTVGRSNMELFMLFTDLRTLSMAIPEAQKQQVNLDVTYDTLTATMQGISLGIKIVERLPYSTIRMESFNSPFEFKVQLNFTDLGGNRTDFSIVLDAELNGMLKLMLGKKLQQGLDKAVDALVNASAQI